MIFFHNFRAFALMFRMVSGKTCTTFIIDLRDGYAGYTVTENNSSFTGKENNNSNDFNER